MVPAANTAEESLILLNSALLLVSVDGRVVDVGRVAHLGAEGAGVPKGGLCIYFQKMAGLTYQVCNTEMKNTSGNHIIIHSA